MTEKDIIKKVKYGLEIASELSDLEFKTASKNIPNDIWRTISAFSNRRGGGLVVFGVSQEKNEITGCMNLDLMQTKLTEYFNDKMSFVLRPEYHVIKIKDKIILAVYIPECPKDYMPCYFKPVGLPNGAYIREGNTSRRITDNEFRTYVATSKEFQFDRSEARGVNKEELSVDKVVDLLAQSELETQRGASHEVSDITLENLGIITRFDGAYSPTIGGYLIFANSIPQNKSPYDRYVIRCVRYAGSDPSSEIIDSADIKGTLDMLIDDSYKFVLKNISKKAVIIGTKRVEKYEYPEEGIRELIANAIIHRDYKIIETCNQIRIFKDRIEIANPGSLPPGVTVENIKEAQFSRNSMIAARLKDLKYLEEYGRGINIVIKKMQEWNLPSPLFRNSVNSFEAILLGEKYRNLNDRQVKLIDVLLLKSRLTIQDCQKILRGTPRATINSDLKKLRDCEIFITKGASVNTYYELAF
ncbi:MAG: ATP-binding protein [Parcubacteria group bacterium]|jgi:ATP-dependent DNA helicase RecG